jgi:hypothetical protein
MGKPATPQGAAFSIFLFLGMFGFIGVMACDAMSRTAFLARCGERRTEQQCLNSWYEQENPGYNKDSERAWLRVCAQKRPLVECQADYKRLPK